MKELSIEEKANAYDEAIKKAEVLYKTAEPMSGCNVLLETVFPELKEETEDERIRQLLLRFVKYDMSDNYSDDFSKEDCLAWLEKQKAIDVLDEEEREFADNVDSYRKEIDAAYQTGYNEGVKTTLEKQGEQPKKHDVCDNCDQQGSCVSPCPMKLVEKVDPKFHEGEWVVNNTTLNSCHILKMEHGQYICDDCSFPITKENEYHLWTIQDAKDGDVLCCENGWTCIFKALDNHKNTYSSYCFMDSDKWFCNAGSECHTLNEQFIKAYNSELHPATKEQRDLLFQKMKEAGYVWDAEKKELRKIEQKPADKIEPKFKVGDKIQYLKGCGTIMTIEKIENSEYIFGNNLGHTTIEDGNKWYLVERNSTWSEEDEEMVKSIIDYIMPMPIFFESVTGESGEEYTEKFVKEAIDWLKSLRPQNKWKPSDEQMIELRRVINRCSYDIKPLAEIEKQLKKLREE